jgi:hypothetical protein
VLIKNSQALERFEKVDTPVVDRREPLTEGKPCAAIVETVIRPILNEPKLGRGQKLLPRGELH